MIVYSTILSGRRAKIGLLHGYVVLESILRHWGEKGVKLIPNLNQLLLYFPQGAFASGRHQQTVPYAGVSHHVSEGGSRCMQVCV